MFANLKKKIEAEVGDLSRLTPSLRSITSHSERLTPLSSRHNSVSSLTSETSTSQNNAKQLINNSPSSSDNNQLLSSPPPQYGQSSNKHHEGANGGKGDVVNQQKLRRQFEEKIQTLELDFAWRLSTKDEEIGKLQKQIEHANTLLHSKEFETQQKLVRVQEDMDSLEGFSQQENAKIKHLLLNREEELSQLRAAVMFKDSAISEFETKVKSISSENERLKKNLDEVVSRQTIAKPNKAESDDLKWEEQCRTLQEKIELLESSKKVLESEKSESIMRQIQEKDNYIVELQTQIENIATPLKKENNDLMIEISKVKNLLSNREEEINQLQSTMMSNASKISGLEMQVKTFSTENEQLQSDLKAVVANQQASDICSKEIILNLQTELQKHQELIFTSAQKFQQVDGLKNSLQTQLKTMQDKVSQLELDKNSLHDEFETYKNQQSGLLDNKLEEKESTVSDLKRQLAELTNNLQQTHENETLNFKKQINELKSELEKKEEVHQKSQDHHASILNNKILEHEQFCKNMQEELKQLYADLNLKTTTITEFEFQIKNMTAENEGLKERLDDFQNLQAEDTNNSEETILNLQSELKRQQDIALTAEKECKESLVHRDSLQSQLKTMQDRVAQLELDKNSLHAEIKSHMSQQSGLDNHLKEKDAVASELKLQISELTENIQMYQKEVVHFKEEIDGLKSELKIKMDALNASEDNASILQSKIVDVEKSVQESTASSSEKDKSIDELQTRVDDLSTVEMENSDLVLQISEIQSKCDELEEENKFLKDAAPKDEYEALKRKIADIEGELLDKTQMLKQQSLQLQDLRRSLAKEINKNQVLSESASPQIEMTSQCNGGAVLSSSPAPPISSSTQPPTLPPQETDVNFMYLRSVLFKYLTTTDAQVTQQLTRVVATLLHLNDEESLQLLQSTEHRNSFFHLLSKSSKS